MILCEAFLLIKTKNILHTWPGLIVYTVHRNKFCVCKTPVGLKLSKPKLNYNSTKPNITLSWVRHENDFAYHPTPPSPHKLNVSNISVVTDPILTIKARSRQIQSKVKERSKQGQGKVKARSRQGQGKVRARFLNLST